MTNDVFKEYCEEITDALKEQRLNQALKVEENILYTNPSWPFMDEVNQIRYAYQGLLNCMSHGFQDDSRKDSFYRLQLHSYQLLHKMERHFLKEFSQTYFSKTCLMADSHKKDYSFYQARLEHLAKSMEKSEDISILAEHEESVTGLFNQLWTTDSFSKQDVQELGDLLFSKGVFLEDKLVCISALTLQQSLCPDAQILFLLMELSTVEELEIQVRATVGWILLLLYHYKEFQLSPSFKEQLTDVCAFKHVQDILCTTINICYLSLETDSVISELQNGIMSFTQLGQGEKGKAAYTEKEIEKKMKGSVNRMFELLKSGADVQYAQFMHDKGYDFFKSLCNWLVPFSFRHTASQYMLHDPNSASIQKLLQSPSLCDNDKWSLLHKVKKLNIPLQLNGLNEEELEMLENPENNIIQCTLNYVHDLYRVYHLFPYQQGLPELLNQDFCPILYPALLKQLSNEHLFRMAKILNYHKKYENCITLTKKLEKDKEYTLEALRLQANAYDALKDYQGALHAIGKLCELEPNKENYQMMVKYLHSAGHKDEAYQLIKDLMKEDSDNLALSKEYLLYAMEREDISEAIPILYKIIYLQKKEEGWAYTLLAHCYLREDKLEEAWAAWEKAEEAGYKPLDWLTAGHIRWAMEDYENAMEFYRLHLTKTKNRKVAEEQLWNTVKFMKKYRLSKVEVRLILEAYPG